MNTDELQGTYRTGAAGLFASAAREPQPTKTEAGLRARRDRILQSFLESGQPPSNDVLHELMAINIWLGEA